MWFYRAECGGGSVGGLWGCVSMSTGRLRLILVKLVMRVGKLSTAAAFAMRGKR